MTSKIQELLQEGSDSRRVLEIHFGTISEEKLSELVEEDLETYFTLNAENYMEHLKQVFMDNDLYREKEFFKTEVDGQLSGFEYIGMYNMYIKK